eukprot:364745-Chlamydomonas_euryale.AAC.2
MIAGSQEPQERHQEAGQEQVLQDPGRKCACSHAIAGLLTPRCGDLFMRVQRQCIILTRIICLRLPSTDGSEVHPQPGARITVCRLLSLMRDRASGWEECGRNFCQRLDDEGVALRTPSLVAAWAWTSASSPACAPAVQKHARKHNNKAAEK